MRGELVDTLLGGGRSVARNKQLKTLSEILPALTEALGICYELVVHDFSNVENSIVAVAGNLTGRKIGGPLTDVVLKELKSGDPQNLIGYANTLPDGRVFRSSTLFVRDGRGKPVGCLCINFDCTAIIGAEKTIRSLVSFTPSEEGKEHFAQDVEQLLSTLINRAIDAAPKPVAQMSKEDKMHIVQLLEEKGTFMIKGGVDTVAAALNLSRATIYAYQQELRGRRIAAARGS